jgi:hypothetical protein
MLATHGPTQALAGRKRPPTTEPCAVDTFTLRRGLNYRPGSVYSDVPLCPAALCQLSVDRGTVNLHAVHIDTHHSSRDIASVVDTLFLNNRFSAAELAIQAAHQQVPSVLAPHQRHTAGTWKRDSRSV